MGVIEVVVVEGAEPPNPVDSAHSDHSSVGGEDFVPETASKDRA